MDTGPTYQCAMTGSWDKTMKVTDSYILVCVYMYLYMYLLPLHLLLPLLLFPFSLLPLLLDLAPLPPPPPSPLTPFPSVLGHALTPACPHPSPSRACMSAATASMWFVSVPCSSSPSSSSFSSFSSSSSSSLLLHLSYRCTRWQWLVLLPEV